MNLTQINVALASSSILSIGMMLAPLPSHAIMFICQDNTVRPFCANPPDTNFIPSQPGETAINPFLPTSIDNRSFLFESIIVTIGVRRFFDPIVALGYDYNVTGGPLFSEVLAPSGINFSNTFDLIYGATNVSLTAGVPYIFGSPQSNFRIQGIDVAANLDPANPTAFVTGLTFDSSGTVNVTQTPITFNTSAVPGPLPLFGVGAAFGLSRKLRQRIKHSKA
jgi:hypothetical protein